MADNYNATNGTGVERDVPFGMDTPDKDLVSTITTWLKESITWHDVILKAQEKCVQYYLGNQTDKEDVPAYNSNSVYNRIFEATETIVPIVTGGAHQFIAIPGEDNERSLIRAQKVQKVLSRKYEDLEIQHKLENVTRDIILKRFGVIKYFWNIYTDDIDCKVIDSRLILIPKLRMDANDPAFPYVMEVQEYTREEMHDFFPGVDEKDLVFGRNSEVQMPAYNITEMNRAPVYQVIEVTTNEMKVWKQGDKILKKQRNPYFDWDGEDEEVSETQQNGKVVKKTFKRFYNHLDYPQKDYVFFNPFTTGDAPISETSLAEIGMPIQDDINTQKRQIINNLIKMGNGQVYVDSDAIEKELVDQITSEPGLIIEGKNLASENRIRREPGIALPQSHFANLQESIVAFDNVFGTHGAVRGAAGDTTLGGQMLNRQQDLSRIDQITRVLNRGVARLVDGFVQMMKMYYNEEHVVKILGRDGAIEFIKFTREDIDDDIVINVKSGTPPSLDPIARYNQAIQLWQLGALDPETLFERLEFSDPALAAQKLQAWKQGQLMLESDIRTKEAMAGVAAKAATAGGTGTGETPRDVETPNDVMARATEALGGAGKAPLTNTPNM